MNMCLAVRAPNLPVLLTRTMTQPANFRARLEVVQGGQHLLDASLDGSLARDLENLERACTIVQACLRDQPALCTAHALHAPCVVGSLTALEHAYGDFLAEHLSIDRWAWEAEDGARPTGPMLVADTNDVYDADWSSVPLHVALLWFISGHADDVLTGLADELRDLPFEFGSVPGGPLNAKRFTREIARRAHDGAGWKVLPMCLRWADKSTGNPLIDAWIDDNGAFHDWQGEFTFSRRSLTVAHRLTRQLERFNNALDVFKRWLDEDPARHATELITLWRKCHA